MYAKSLVRSVAGRELKKASSRVDVLDDSEQRQQDARREKAMVAAEVHEVEANSEEETSILCGDEADVAREVGKQQVDTIESEDPTPEEYREEIGQLEDDDEDDDDDVVLPVRSRQTRMRRCVESDSESDYEEERTESEEESDVAKKEQEDMQTEEPQPMSMRPPHKKGHSTISAWAQEAIDLTDLPHAPDSLVLTESTRARSSSFAMSRPATSSSETAHPFLT